jgi:hypothetical protein
MIRAGTKLIAIVDEPNRVVMHIDQTVPVERCLATVPLTGDQAREIAAQLILKARRL